MDGDLKAYLDSNFTALSNKIDGVEKSMNATIAPIQQTLNRHTADIADLYNRDRQQVTVCEQHREKTGEKISTIMEWKTAQEAQAGGKKWRAEQIIIVAVGLAGLVGGVVLAVIGI
jgi:hypothetical protein